MTSHAHDNSQVFLFYFFYFFCNMYSKDEICRRIMQWVCIFYCWFTQIAKSTVINASGHAEGTCYVKVRWGASTWKVTHSFPTAIREPCWRVTDEKCNVFKRRGRWPWEEVRVWFTTARLPTAQGATKCPPLVSPWPLQIGRHLFTQTATM
jgi:hypothetical protein